MLEFNENTQNAKILAVHYAKAVGGLDLIAFMSGEIDIQTMEQAKGIAEGFRKMVDLAVEDHHNNVAIQGIVDIEFWMHKLFNKVYGYMVRSGFSEVWDSCF